jgi:hypothetical protein
LASRKQTQDIRNSNAQAANAWTTMHAVRVYRDSCQKV